MKNWAHRLLVIGICFSGLTTHAMESEHHISDDILPFNFGSDALIGHPALLASYNSLFEGFIGYSSIAHSADDKSIQEPFGYALFMDVEARYADFDMRYFSSSDSSDTTERTSDIEIDSSPSNEDFGYESENEAYAPTASHGKLQKSKTPILDAFLACTGLKMGAVFSDKQLGKIQINNLPLIMKCIDLKANKPTPTKQNSSRIKALSVWFEGFTKNNLKQGEFGVTAIAPHVVGIARARVEAQLNSKTNK